MKGKLNYAYTRIGGILTGRTEDRVDDDDEIYLRSIEHIRP